MTKSGETRINWTDEEKAALRTLLEAGLSTAQAAAEIGRSVGASDAMRKSLGIRDLTRRAHVVKQVYSRPAADVQRTERACMACTRPFPSEGPHNRLCKDCRRRDSYEDISFTGRIL